MTIPQSRTLFALLQEEAERYPERIAVICRDRESTYTELAERAGRVAAGLRARGIGDGSRVGILIDNRREWLEAAIGATAAGAVAMPFSTFSKAAELEFLFGDAEIDALIAVDVVAGQDFAAAIASLLHRPGRFPRLQLIAMLGDARPNGIAYEDLLATAPILRDTASPGDDCFILYTSGSSARPKAVRLRHASLIENGFNIGERMRLSPDDRVLLAPPLFWSYGAANALPATFTHAAALVLQPRFEPGEWLGLVERHSCTAAYTLPSMTGAVLRHCEFHRERVASLRTGLMIGSSEEVRIAAEELGAAEICNIYGATETYGNCCVTPCDWPLARRVASQGPPLSGNVLRVVDAETGAPLPAGETGLVEVTGHVTPGYAGASAEHNATAFTGDGYFRTGDLGFLDDAGDFHFAGRDSDVIKRVGINVSPAEVESLLLQHPDVAQAAVVGAPAGERGEAIVAFVVPRPGTALDPEMLRAHCRALASSYKVPDWFEFCAALPVTETGKLFRRALKERAAAPPYDSQRLRRR